MNDAYKNGANFWATLHNRLTSNRSPMWNLRRSSTTKPRVYTSRSATDKCAEQRTTATPSTVIRLHRRTGNFRVEYSVRFFVLRRRLRSKSCACAISGLTENAGVENAIRGQKCKGGKCRSRQAVWKAEPILGYTLINPEVYFLKIVLRFLSE